MTSGREHELLLPSMSALIRTQLSDCVSLLVKALHVSDHRGQRADASVEVQSRVRGNLGVLGLRMPGIEVAEDCGTKRLRMWLQFTDHEIL